MEKRGKGGGSVLTFRIFFVSAAHNGNSHTNECYCMNRICVRMNFSTSLRGSLEVEERSRGNICSSVEPAAVEPGEGNAVHSCRRRPRRLKLLLPQFPAPSKTLLAHPPPQLLQPALIIHDVTSTSRFFCFLRLESFSPSRTKSQVPLLAAPTAHCLLSINR